MQTKYGMLCWLSVLTQGNVINATGSNVVHVFLRCYFLQKQSFLVVMKGPFLLRVMIVMMSVSQAQVGGVFEKVGNLGLCELQWPVWVLLHTFLGQPYPQK